MKLRLILSLVSLSLLLNGCCRAKNNLALATTHQTLSDISQISIEGYGDIELKQGESEFLDIKTTTEALKHIETKIEKTHLKVRIDSNKIPKPLPEISLSIGIKQLESFHGAGALNLNLNVDTTDKIKFNFAGTINAKATIHSRELDLALSGSSRANLTGRVERQDIQITGSSVYDAVNLESSFCAISAAGAVTAKINCSKKIDGTVTGASVLSVTGNPELQVETSGASAIKKIK